MIHAPAHCTIRAYARWTREHAHHGRIPQRVKPAMWRLEACVDREHGPHARITAIRARMRFLRSQAWDQTHPWSWSLASWYYAAGGPIACGGDSYTLGVANRSLPCGTRVEMCFARCVDAVVFDRGPAAWTGREWDLSVAVRDATGFPDGVASVRWRLAR